MSFDKNIADKILEFAKLEPTVPVGTSHDFHSEEFDQDDFRDTAKKLISTGQISGHLEEDFSGFYIAFRL
ncbi:hypothetical protein [Streptococcus pneumoniae]|uniref:hypothetical protein n=1 Tax=Streptococcus pneumoniae TaxID=1313 RepID=UPI000777C2B7|nr:hypothetical protein [Streptococcus pneumoniae]APD22403.1 hypothetical protein IPP24_00008 [Streptococcus phage IPP24]KXV98602.1 hypothetical protein NTPn6_02680 [Streptococcus pneumoniae]MBT1061237.1 hypothetical protein [Streptococcus pneumoniae]MDG7095132.1 hypothetical protein [Streptococcus pneumoniae]MDG7242763.1 hypothetical protein [Streptococcus pneumoniae]